MSAWSRIEIVQGDITTLAVDAIVNAANAQLAGGGGVDGAIHRAAGRRELQAACAKLGGCVPGDAKITPGFALPARFVIHTVGPVYVDGQHGEAETLASAYQRSLEVLVESGLRTIAFPAISTGVYGFPFEAATVIAMRTVAAFLGKSDSVDRVTLIFHSGSGFGTARRLYERLRLSAD